jgi:hypothetical protein
LMEYGNFFTIEPFKKWFKMIPISNFSENENLEIEEIDLNKLK